MVVRVDDEVIFKNVNTVPVFQTAADAVANSGSTGYRYTNQTVYVRQIWGRSKSGGNAIDLGKSANTNVIHAIAYGLKNSGVGDGWMNYRALNLDAMGSATPIPPPTGGGGGTGGSTGYSFNNIGFNHGTQTTLGGDGLLINPTALPSAHHIRFNISYRNSNNISRSMASYRYITGRTTADFSESEAGTILSDMGSASSITATAAASLYANSGSLVDTKKWTITIYKGQTVSGPKSSNPSNPISITVSNGGTGGIIYPGHSTLKVTFAHVEPGYGTLTSLLLTDGQGFSWNLTTSNNSSTGSITTTLVTPHVPQRWHTSTQTLRLVATNSSGQQTIIKSNIISLKAETYSGIGISSFILSSRLDNSVSLTGDGVFDTKISTRPTFKIDLLNPSGVVVQTTGWKTTTANGTGKWKVSQTFSSLSPISSYLARLTIQDNNNRQSSQTVNIGGAAVPLSLGRNGAGVGVMVNDNLSADLQVGTGGISSSGPIYENGQRVVTNVSGLFQVVTQVQYNGLTTAQKNDPSKIYLIRI